MYWLVADQQERSLAHLDIYFNKNGMFFGEVSLESMGRQKEIVQHGVV